MVDFAIPVCSEILFKDSPLVYRGTHPARIPRKFDQVFLDKTQYNHGQEGCSHVGYHLPPFFSHHMKPVFYTTFKHRVFGLL